jgi:hypothetical protein
VTKTGGLGGGRGGQHDEPDHDRRALNSTRERPSKRWDETRTPRRFPVRTARTSAPAAASLLVFDGGGNVYAEFPGYGLNEYQLATGWARLNDIDVKALAVNANGEIAASFSSYGTYTYTAAGGWVQINGTAAAALAIDPNGNVAASFAGLNTALYRPWAAGWQSLVATAATLLAMDSLGNVYGSFAGHGLYRYEGNGWLGHNSDDAALLAVA